MIEVDSMSQPVVVEDLDADALLSACVEAESQARVAERRKLRYALQWAHLHPADPRDVARDQVEVAGGEGTPAVAEFTAEALAASFQITPAAARQLLGDALDLAHRHPRLWKRVEALEVPVWRARRIVQATHHLSAEHAARVEAEVAPIAQTCGVARLERIIADLTAQTDPEEQASEEELSRQHWDVRLFHGPAAGLGRWTGTSVLEITGDTATLTDLYHRLNDAATTAGAAGDPDPIGVRRAKAAAGLGAAEATGRRRHRTQLYLHADLTDLTDDTIGVGSVERLGPLTIARIKEWVGHGAVTVLPVIRMDRDDAVDEHDPPRWMRELVMIRDEHCVFPGCQTPARVCDVDHIEPYVDPDTGGPPGQTSPDNLACLCRHHHRTKTDRHWRYRRLDPPAGPSVYLWTDPHDRQYVVDRTGTHALGP